MSLCISTVGGDSRQYYMLLRLFTYFSRICQPVLIKCYGLNISPEQQTGLQTCYHDGILFCSGLPEAVKGADLLICPAPFTRDGIHLNLSDRANSVSISELSDLKHLPAFIAGGGIPKHFSNSVKSRTLLKDYMKDSDFLNTNSTLTAEGLLSYIIRNTDCSITGARILIAGYGHCGEQIAAKLSALSAEISIFDKDPDRQKAAEDAGFPFYDIRSWPFVHADFDLIINTIPSPVFKSCFLRRLKKDCVLFEVASRPGGFDEDMCRGLSLKLISCPGIPGKTAPKPAGEAIADAVLPLLKQF